MASRDMEENAVATQSVGRNNSWLVFAGDLLIMSLTVLPCVDTELVDTRWRLSQNIDGVAGGVHVVEEVDWQRRECKHQQPQHS